ncbi:MAG: ABC transporter ATP-binding protein [Thermoflavifilum sp.]|nr:ABC transporter ATP-binding protein [Thermoflavifilum sp.]
MSEPIIILRELTKQYDQAIAVDHLNLTINKGEIFGLLGPNGAGKSTTILMLLGLTEPTSGEVQVCGIDPVSHPVEVKRKVGYLPDNVRFYEDLTGIENLIYTGQLNRMTKKQAREKALQLLTRVGLADAAHQKTGTYSRGMIQRLGLADVLMKDPEVIIMDEPTLGIDPTGAKDFLNLIVRLSREDAITVLLSSHYLLQVQEVCDRIGLFVKGKLIAVGDIASLSQELFANEPFRIEAIIHWERNSSWDTISALKQLLLQINGVAKVDIEDERLHISATQDVTAQVARTIVMQGIDLLALSKREHGLEDIYHRYFESESIQ